ncbi:hypothetical protein HYS31_03600, partial [Candidatus Woesearchaeota archaeon]|nr:hypothetical protein [Candidatus Woesearchaeota archaeon]
MDEIKKVLMTRQGRKFYAKDTESDVHTQYGFVRKEDLKKSKEGDLMNSNTGKEFFIFNP